VHIGTGTGYYTAIIACLVGPSGKVTGIEVDASLAARAKENLSPYSNILIVEGYASGEGRLVRGRGIAPSGSD
jgi:protein-L-isoaspartate(D-aspartate) O-methyltransferase